MTSYDQSPESLIVDYTMGIIYQRVPSTLYYPSITNGLGLMA
jgi:hypothetical protein